MQKRYVPITAILVILAVVASVGYLMPEPTPEIPDRILLDNAAGKVVFNHQKHFKNGNISCQTCHHELIGDNKAVQSCGTCHGVAFTDTFRKKHPQEIQSIDACATCHHMSFAPNAQWSHTAHVEDYELECTSCHHEDTNIEPEPQNCADCHDSSSDDAAMPALREAVHAKCQNCHDDMFASQVNGCTNCHTAIKSRKLVAEEGTKALSIEKPYANCASCHVNQATVDLIPDRMSAFHGQCIVCHEKVGKGPFTKDQCNQCHTK